MWQYIQKFLYQYKVAEGPLLIGYSGGVDSTALLTLLRRCTANLHVLHINHGWRKTALDEAYALCKQIQAYNIPFYVEQITHIDPQLEKNLEDRYRQERLKIFQKYYEQIGAKALLLAHQKDDQAETVFKRIFEGASLGKLSGLREYSEFEGMKILRPLLPFTKEELYQVLSKEKIGFIEDETNKNPAYLRARQREQIFPLIESKFGKNAAHNLCRFSQNLNRYESYMERKVKRYETEMMQGPFGIYLNLKDLYPLEELELEYFIRKISEHYGCSISYDALNILIGKIKEGSSNKKVLLKKGEWIIDRGYLFFLSTPPSKTAMEEQAITQLPGEFDHQGFKWKLEEVKELYQATSWQALWSGSIEFRGSNEAFTITAANPLYRIHDQSLKEFYSENKIPVFLRTMFPHVFQGKELRSTCLISIPPPSSVYAKVFRLSVKTPI
jgi:tRNA(Ile)-lysidine synthase